MSNKASNRKGRRFDGKHYAEQQRLPGNVAPEGKRYLAGEFTFQDGILLEPTK